MWNACNQVAQQNFVTNLEVLPASLPGADGQPALAGAGSQLLVALQIEDGRPLPWEAVTEGLSLRLEPPLQAQQQGSGTVAAVPGRGRGGRGGAPRRPDAVVLEPERLWEPPGDGEAAGGDDAAAAAAAEAASRGCVAVFAAHDLTAAGSYTVTAEYAETRAELLPGLTKQVSERVVAEERDACMRSMARGCCAHARVAAATYGRAVCAWHDDVLLLPGLHCMRPGAGAAQHVAAL